MTDEELLQLMAGRKPAGAAPNPPRGPLEKNPDGTRRLRTDNDFASVRLAQLNEKVIHNNLTRNFAPTVRALGGGQALGRR